MTKTQTILTFSAFVLGGVILLPSAANAYRGDPTVKGPYYTQERRAAMERAFANRDYNAWKSLMQGRGRVTQVINKDNFAKFVQAHELAEQGKLQEAAQIRQQLGLGLQNGSGKGMGFGRHQSR